MTIAEQLEMVVIHNFLPFSWPVSTRVCLRVQLRAVRVDGDGAWYAFDEARVSCSGASKGNATAKSSLRGLSHPKHLLLASETAWPFMEAILELE